MKARHVSLIAWYSTRFIVRSGMGLVFLFLSLIFGLVVANAMIQPVEQVTKRLKKEGLEIEQSEVLKKLTDTAEPAVQWVLGSSKANEIKDDVERKTAVAALEKWTDHLLHKRPALLSAIVLILLWGWPFLVVFGSFNLYSGDIQSRGLRYQLIRADRASIYWGRIVGNLMTYVAVLLLLFVVVVAYIGLRLPFHDWGGLITLGLWGTIALLVLTVPYVGLCAWLSASIDSPMVSLVLGSLFVGGVPLLAMFASRSWSHGDKISYLLPWGYQTHLLHHEITVVALTVVGCLLHGLVFFWLGQRKFLKRDL